MPMMRVAQVSRAQGPFEIVERPIPEPGPGAVRIKVHACGVCHSDSLTKEGVYPGIAYPPSYVTPVTWPRTQAKKSPRRQGSQYPQ